jgi:hypothetical protein
MANACLFEGSGEVQSLSVKELYQGILHHLDLVCVPTEFTNCIQEVQKAKFYIQNIKRNWFELQRRNIISFPLHYGAPGHIRLAEYPEYLSDQLQCCKCLCPIQMNTTFYIQCVPYVRMGTQECAACTKQVHNQRMNTEIHSSICRMLLNTLRIIGVIIQDRLAKLLRLEREMSLL